MNGVVGLQTLRWSFCGVGWVKGCGRDYDRHEILIGHGNASLGNVLSATRRITTHGKTELGHYDGKTGEVDNI